eukprot:5035030-Amphidinium_carterae.1
MALLKWAAAPQRYVFLKVYCPNSFAALPPSCKRKIWGLFCHVGLIKLSYHITGSTRKVGYQLQLPPQAASNASMQRWKRQQRCCSCT